MRVTQQMLNTQLLRDVNNNLGRMEKLQNQLATGRKINKPSDDPVGISFSLRYRNRLNENEQYKRNTDNAISWTAHTESMIKEANDILQRVRELSVQGATDTNTDLSLEAIGQEMEQLYEHMVAIGNSQFNGKYIFNGQMTDVRPYDETNAEMATPNKDKILLEVGVGIIVPSNTSGVEVFGDAADPTNAFKIIKDLKNSLMAHDTQAVNTSLGMLDKRMDSVLEKWSEVGARSNRLDLIMNRLEDEMVNINTLLSKTEDADMAELMINMKAEENVYQASLSTGAKIIRPSLIDFLR